MGQDQRMNVPPSESSTPMYSSSILLWLCPCEIAGCRFSSRWFCFDQEETGSLSVRAKLGLHPTTEPSMAYLSSGTGIRRCSLLNPPATHQVIRMTATQSSMRSVPLNAQSVLMSVPPASAPTTLKEKASRFSRSMLDLFAHRRSRQRSTSSTDPLESEPQPASPTATTKLKKCASVGVSSIWTSGKTDWGMIPVLNELERHPSFTQNGVASLQKRRRASQSACLNCHQLFFKDLSDIDAEFCSLDCQSTHQYVHGMQDVIDVQLELTDGSVCWSGDTSGSSTLSSSPMS